MIKVAFCMAACAVGLSALVAWVIRDYLIQCELEAAAMGEPDDYLS